MRITTALCSRNRSTQLRSALDEMTNLLIPAGVDWELLVVNNGSSDGTEAVIYGFSSRLPIRRIFEARPGLSYARNRAIREATGEYIIWTDDDVAVSREWLTAYHQAFRQWPDAAIFGGPVRPVFLGRPPTWLLRVRDRVGPVFAARPLGPEPTPIVERDVPFGANMAVRRREQRTCLYDTRLVVSEETTCLRTILRDGSHGWWVPGAAVDHIIPESRQTVGHLWRYYAAQGEFDARTHPNAAGATLLGRPRWSWSELVLSQLRFWQHRLCCRPETWIEDLVQASYSYGRFKGFALPRLDLTDPHFA